VANGEVLAFTDDDVNVADGWLDTVRSAMEDTRVALVGGPVLPRWQKRAPRWLRLTGNGYGRLGAPLALLDYGPHATDLGARTLLGANIAVRHAVIRRIGGFATHLGKLRGTLLSGEDHELCRRIQAAGFDARYCPDARVRHWVPADRMRVRYFLDWFFWSGITHAALDHTAARPRRALWGVPFYLVKRFATGTVGALVATATFRPSAAVEHAIDAAFAGGYAASRWGFVAVEPPTAEEPAGGVA
jgi:GT2 family glycosyltransferase